MKTIDVACIVDDDPIFVYALKRTMNLTNFCKNLMIFNNGQEAFDNLKSIVKYGESLPDVILLDLNMPIMDGWQFLDSIVDIELQKKITIYIISSTINPVDLERVKQYELVSDFVLKPVTKQILKEIMMEASKSS